MTRLGVTGVVLAWILALINISAHSAIQDKQPYAVDPACVTLYQEIAQALSKDRTAVPVDKIEWALKLEDAVKAERPCTPYQPPASPTPPLRSAADFLQIQMKRDDQNFAIDPACIALYEQIFKDIERGAEVPRELIDWALQLENAVSNGRPCTPYVAKAAGEPSPQQPH